MSERATTPENPEGLLLSVLLATVGQRLVVREGQSLEPFYDLGGMHRRAVVGQKPPWKAALLHGLHQAVHEGLGVVGDVPLEVASDARAVIEKAEHTSLLAV